MDGNARFQEEMLAQLAGIIDRQVLQMVEAAVGSVLRSYELPVVQIYGITCFWSCFWRLDAV